MYELVSSKKYFYGKIQSTILDLIYNQIKLNLSIWDSNQTWDSSELCIFESKNGVESHKSIQVNWVLRLTYYLH